MDISELFEIVVDEWAAFQAAEDKRAFCVDRSAELYKIWIQPIDMPGPDYILDPLVKAMVQLAVGHFYDTLAAKYGTDDPITLIVGADAPTGRLLLNWRKRRELGLTIPAILRELNTMDSFGDIDGVDRSEIARLLIDRLKAANPKLQAEAAADGTFMERFIAFIKFILPFLLLFI